MLSNILLLPTKLPPPPTAALLLRLQPDLRLLILLKPLDLTAVLLILARPLLRQILHILHKAINAPVVYPQANQPYTTPQHQSDDQIDPEQNRAVHHIQDLEADEQRRDNDEDGRCIRLGNEPCEQRREVCLQSAKDAECGCDQGEQRRGDGRREQPRQQRNVVCVQ
jgi:hypothetical protein